MAVVTIYLEHDPVKSNPYELLIDTLGHQKHHPPM